MSQPRGVRVRLRHLNGTPRNTITPNKDPIIKKNLEPLIQNNKKKVAQLHYYERHPEHQSPLMREPKEPVHQRLGVKQIRLKRLVPLGTNTSAILPKRKFARFPQNNMRNLNTPGQFKRQKLQRMYSAQARLERIRSQQRNNNSTIKLRRLNTGLPLPPATNFQVQVKNPNFVPMANNPAFTYNGFQKFKMVLNSEIQAEIIEIQKDSTATIGSLPPLTTITPVTTDLPISSRFGLL